MQSGGGIFDLGLPQCAEVLLALLDRLMESFCFVVIVSDENKLIPLSVHTLPHLLNLLMLDSGIDLDARIEDWVPLAGSFGIQQLVQKNLVDWLTCAEANGHIFVWLWISLEIRAGRQVSGRTMRRSFVPHPRHVLVEDILSVGVVGHESGTDCVVEKLVLVDFYVLALRELFVEHLPQVLILPDGF